MKITEEQTIWFPGVYAGRTDGEYSKRIADISLVELTELVQERAQMDGQWAIDNGFVGDNEANMRRMMEFVSKEENIQQCVGHILEAGEEEIRTVDWVCHELAKASRYLYGSKA